MELPQIIYYCWFGKQPLASKVKSYIQTWKDHFPTYEIIQIDETNFDITVCEYTKVAYEQQQYAFVSDYARIFYLQLTGGIYFDTDVEVKKSFQPLLNQYHTDILVAMEYFAMELTGISTAVILSKKNCSLWHDLLQFYQQLKFDRQHIHTINQLITSLLCQQTNFRYRNTTQTLLYQQNQIQIVKAHYLMLPHRHAFAIHHLDGSWTSNLPFFKKVRRICGLCLKKIVGRKVFEKIWSKNLK